MKIKVKISEYSTALLQPDKDTEYVIYKSDNGLKIQHPTNQTKRVLVIDEHGQLDLRGCYFGFHSLFDIRADAIIFGRFTMD